MPQVGQKQAKATRHMLPSGFRTYAGEIAQGISAPKRARIVARAKELNVRLTNGQAKLKKVSAE
jgi:ribosomal protein L32E